MARFPRSVVTHAIMGILYGAMLANLIPMLSQWWSLPSALVPTLAVIPDLLRWGLLGMAAGVLASGVRDLYAALELPYAGWPWSRFSGADLLPPMESRIT